MPHPEVTAEAVEKAAARIAGAIVHTPTLRSKRLSKLFHADVWLKYENLQHTGAYKERGALNKLLQLKETRDREKLHVITASAGNHAQGIAYHAKRLCIPATILMPIGTPLVKVQQTQSHGAFVIEDGEIYDVTKENALSMAATQGLTYVDAFDDADIINGQGTVAIEMWEDAVDQTKKQKEFDILVVQTGGGGLVAGMATWAMNRNPKLRVLVAEPAVCPSFYNQRKYGRPTTDSKKTLAEGIFVQKMGKLSFKIADKFADDLVLRVSEDWIEHAIALLCCTERTVVEGAGAASLAGMLQLQAEDPERFSTIFHDKKVGLVLSGGNIDGRLMSQILMRDLVRGSRLCVIAVRSEDRPGNLAKITQIIGAQRGNIMTVRHHRSTLKAPAKAADLEIEVEVQDDLHLAEIVKALKAAGFEAQGAPGHLDD